MSCASSSVTLEERQDQSASCSTATGCLSPNELSDILRSRRRRHSFHTSRRLSGDHDADAVFLKVRFPAGLQFLVYA